MKLFKKAKTNMEQEIFAQAKILQNVIDAYTDEQKNIIMDVPEGVEHVVFVASGSSYHCARFAAELFGVVANIEARAIYSSEFLLKSVIPHFDNMLYVFITQSGETSDTNSALVRAKELGVKTLSITNKEDSTIWKASDYQLACHAGDEKSIAATKSLSTQFLCVTLLAAKLAQQKGIDTTQVVKDIFDIPQFVEQVYELRPQLKKMAKFVSKYKHAVVTAEGMSYGLAKEAALKIKETSYMNVTPAFLGEFMHGHVAVFNHKAVLIYLSAGDLSYTAIKNLNKIKDDYNPPICILGNKNVKINTAFNININCESSLVKSFCILIMIQILALEIATKLHRDVDKPHGLVKVVQ